MIRRPRVVYGSGTNFSGGLVFVIESEGANIARFVLNIEVQFTSIPLEMVSFFGLNPSSFLFNWL